MSQRKKQAYPHTAGTTGPRHTSSPLVGRDRRIAPRRGEENRRRITFAIVLVGLVIATWVVMASFGSGAPSSQPQQETSDTRNLEAAIASLQERLRQDPSDTAAMVQLGNSYYDAGRWTEAIPWYEKALQAIPANTDVRTDLGTAYFYSGNLDKAKEQWFKSLEYDANKVQTHYNLAVLYSHQTPPDIDKAAEEWETVVRLAPNSEQGKAAEKRLKDLGKR